MNRPLKMFALVSMISILLTCYALADSKIGWVPITGNEYNMIVYGHIDVEDLDFEKGEYLLFSFGPSGDKDCRSMSRVKQDGLFYSTICGDIPGEVLTFKVINPISQEVYEMESIIVFEPDSTIEDLYLE